MKSLIVLCWLALLAALARAQTLPTCTGSRVRREFRSLTVDQRNAFFSGMRQLYANGTIARLSARHLNNANPIHGNPMFLPFHRAFLRDLEISLLRIVPSVGAFPYWNWALDSQAPERSPILSSIWFGGNGTGTNMCVTNGRFANLTVTVSQPHCLQRRYNLGTRITPFNSPESLSLLIYDYPQFTQFYQILEGSPHGRVHVGIGGDMSRMFSPNDPLFFMHHAYVDKVWRDWQLVNPNSVQYGGQYRDGRTARLSDLVTYYNFPVSRFISTTSDLLCYTYDTVPNGRGQPQVGSNLQTIARRSPLLENLTTSFSVKNRQRSNPLVQDIASKNTRRGRLTRQCARYRRRVVLAPSNRSDLCGLRRLEPVPEDWKRQNNLPDAPVVDEFVRRTNELTAELNAAADYVSPASLAAKIDEGEIAQSALVAEEPAAASVPVEENGEQDSEQDSEDAESSAEEEASSEAEEADETSEVNADAA